MSKSDDTDAVQNVLRTAQIIVGAMGAGVVLFWVIVTAVLPNFGGGGPPAAPMPAAQRILGLPMMTAMAAVFGAGCVAASIVVPKVVVDGTLRRIAKGVSIEDTKLEDSGLRQVYPASDVGKLLPIYMSQLIVASAVAEGGAFFAAIAYMLESHPVAIFMGGVLIALLLSRFPTFDRLQAWLDAQLERLAILRRDDF